MADTIKKKELSDTVYAVDISAFSDDERYSAIALQGIVAKTNPCIYINYGGAYSKYLAEIEESGKNVIRTDENGEKWTYKSLVKQFFDYIGDGGYTLFSYSEYAEGLNVATNFATAFGWLPVPQSLKESAEECGLVLKKDLTAEKYGNAFQRKYFRMLKDYFEKGTVVHINYDMKGLRDLAIEQGYFCFYTLNDIPGEMLMREVLRWSGKNTSVYGWCELEKKTVKMISRMGCHINPADHSYNCSYLSLLECDSCFNNPQAKAYTDESKHYATLVFSDGDNCQWIQNGYGEYYSTVSNFPDAKVSWTFSPVLKSFCPPAYESAAAAANENTCFLCGPSGFGYCNPSRFDARSLELFSTETASAMLKSNERVLTILDDYSEITEGKMAWSFGYFSRFDNIDGGILYLDPGRYEAGKGKVWFSNDKPFASVRLSLWAENGYDGATDEWIKQQADAVNAYPVDIHSIDGYSVICIHAWTMKPEAINKFIGMLDEHIELLSADDFICTMKENIPHKTAMPE
ncbi:MAG: hypothetical protein MJ177_10730 [Clostridia bacterium]|nr:hypothetical protein [Clostridia bacterium]